VCHCGIHTHSFTCKKPPKGWHGCRLCYKKGFNNGTKPVELVYTIQPDGTIEWYELQPEGEGRDQYVQTQLTAKPVCHQIQPDGTIEWYELQPEGEGHDQYERTQLTEKNELFPLESDCIRTIVWELDRPELEPLSPLAEDLSKDDIISSLYQQMFPGKSKINADQPNALFDDGFERISIKQVDLHEFNHNDNNSLFFSFLLGLVELSILAPGEVSVQFLRGELMKYLSEHPDDIYDGKSLKSHAMSYFAGLGTDLDDTTLNREKNDDNVKSMDLVDTDGDTDEEVVDADVNSNANVRPRRSKRLQHNNEAPDKMQRVSSYSLSDYTEVMRNIIGEKCFRGGRLEVYLFAKVKNVNVALYKKDGEDLVLTERIVASESGVNDRHTIHLLVQVRELGASRRNRDKSNQDEYIYTLFVPKMKHVMDKLRMFDVHDLRRLYTMVSDSLVERNGWVVDFNPLLASLLGCNSNHLHLGSTEQSKAALFYIGPYINKDGVKITDALPILLKAQEHVINNPSVAEDSGTNKRHVQHTLTRTLNRMNNMIEVTDTQVAATLLGMGASLCSESFVTCDTEGYVKFATDEFNRTQEKSSCCDFGNHVDDNESESDSAKEKEYYDETDILFDLECNESINKGCCGGDGSRGEDKSIFDEVDDLMALETSSSTSDREDNSLNAEISYCSGNHHSLERR